MKKFKIILSIFALSIFIFNACNEDTTSTVDNNTNNSEYVTASDKIFTGTLKYKEYDFSTDTYKLSPWNKGEGFIKVSVSTTDEVGSGYVDANGNFTLTLSGKMLKTNLTDFKSMAGGLTWTPQSFNCMIIPAVVSIYPSTIEAQFLLNYGVLNTDLSKIVYYFGFVYCDQTASITGTSTIGDTYDLHYTKGWNIWKWHEDDLNKTHYSTVSDLPTDIVWYL